MEKIFSKTLTVEELLREESYQAYVYNGKQEKIEEFVLANNKTLSIPGYQREIRWGKKNVDILFDNLNNRDKFLGSILISHEESNKYDIIDGQQRITVLLLLIRAILKAGHAVCADLCKYNNDTIISFEKMFECDFDETIMKSLSVYEECVQGDILEQRFSLKEIWDAINERLQKVARRNHQDFLNKVLRSKIDVIMCVSNGVISSDSVCVDYFLDLNSKSVKLDSVDILKAELFRKNYSLMTERWIEVQKSIKMMNMVESRYSIKQFFYHYFSCVVNQYLGYQLKQLTPELKTMKEIKDGVDKIPIGTHVIDAISDSDFCEKAMKEIEQCVKCFKDITDSKGNIYPEFFLYFGGQNSTDAHCAYYIINTILKMDNEVPKVLITKYFLDIMNNPNSKSKDYEIIYDIYVIAILFTTSNAKKTSTQFIRIVLEENWKESLKELAKNKYQSGITNIIYDKATKSNNQISKTSGQYLPKHIFAIRQFILLNQDETKLYVPNKGKLKEFLEKKTTSAEHFLVNQSEKYVFSYAKGEISINCPSSIKKYISFPVNYLYLDKDENSALGDATIVDKIAILSKKDKSVFASELVYQYFLVAKEIFENSTYPKNLNDIVSKREATRLVRRYYVEDFTKDIKKYIERLSKIQLVYSKEVNPPIWKVKE